MLKKYEEKWLINIIFSDKHYYFSKNIMFLLTVTCITLKKVENFTDIADNLKKIQSKNSYSQFKKPLPYLQSWTHFASRGCTLVSFLSLWLLTIHQLSTYDIYIEIILNEPVDRLINLIGKHVMGHSLPF